ncbi:hypothetical protein MIND_00731400 [Mycena indigotica]|uniref:HMA domain-containing protein n=1 Tax=Mycena indigotica TaxID=2126181 RepID=A0A8H6W717_9AGAR|nr:uncharacterized protein MIND_00731400 [Mycena indigotica]KAF7301659.1 hypothetical protein MIND_00731400 [Mycena indigotica]
MLSKKASYRFSPGMASPLGYHTIFTVANLHCGSCCLTIEHALATLDPPPLKVDVSVVKQTVSVYHPAGLSPELTAAAIRDAGFDIDEPPSLHSIDDVDGLHQKHLQQCTFCQKANVDLAQPRLFRLTLSVSGMSCASCTNSITRALEELTGVSEVAVSLLSHSAAATIDDEDRAKAAVDAIEDCGFGAHVVSVEPIRVGIAEQSPLQSSRTISLRVDGMFCQHCPNRALDAIRSLGPRVVVDAPFPSLVDPVFHVTYQPDAPKLTIRTIITALEQSNSPPFKVSLFNAPSLEDRAKHMRAREQKSILCRGLVTFIVAIPTFILSIVFMSLVHDNNPTKMYLMSPMWTGNTSRASWALFFLSIPAMFYGAGLFHRRSIKELYGLWRPGSKTPIWRRLIRFGSMNLLVSLGVSVAFFASIGLLALAARQPRQDRGDSTTYFDSVVFLTLFLLAGRYLEGYSKARTADAVTALAGLRPAQTQIVVTDFGNDLTIPEKPAGYDPEKAYDDSRVGKDMRVLSIPADLLEVGDIIRCNTGATPPADGTILSLTAGEMDVFTFDESMLTGESMPVTKRPGDKVYLGSINRSHAAFIRVDSVGGGTMQVVSNRTFGKAQGIQHDINRNLALTHWTSRRAPIERLADLCTAYFVPLITLLAILTFLVWLVLAYSGALPSDYLDIPIGGWFVWALEFSIAALVAACPCGIGLAAPTALLVGSGMAAKAGILARGGGEAFQEMSRVDIVCFDKTGTLTTGTDPSVSDSIFPPLNVPLAREDLLGMAAALESATSHPLGHAVHKFCLENRAKDLTVSDIHETPGLGVSGHFGPTSIVVGSQKFVEQNGGSLDQSTIAAVDGWKETGKSVVFMAVSREAHWEVAAVFAVSDPIRAEAPEVIAWLKEQGIIPWIISGDNPTTTVAVAKELGVSPENVIAGVLPHEKAEKIELLQRSPSSRRSRHKQPFRSVVAMVGDGINDSVALTVADVGIAIGSGSDVAVSSASFILLSSDLNSLRTLSDLSRRIINRVKFNFAWAIVYNLCALPIAAGVLYPAHRVRLDPVWASLAMALSSISVILSSLALKLYSPRSRK